MSCFLCENSHSLAKFDLEIKINIEPNRTQLARGRVKGYPLLGLGQLQPQILNWTRPNAGSLTCVAYKACQICEVASQKPKANLAKNGQGNKCCHRLQQQLKEQQQLQQLQL